MSSQQQPAHTRCGVYSLSAFALKQVPELPDNGHEPGAALDPSDLWVHQALLL